jgi:hypothetical protein
MNAWDRENARVGGTTPGRLSGWDAANAAAKERARLREANQPQVQVPPPPSAKQLQYQAEADQYKKEADYANSKMGLLTNTLKAMPGNFYRGAASVVNDPYKTLIATPAVRTVDALGALAGLGVRKIGEKTDNQSMVNFGNRALAYTNQAKTVPGLLPGTSVTVNPMKGFGEGGGSQIAGQTLKAVSELYGGSKAASVINKFVPGNRLPAFLSGMATGGVAGGGYGAGSALEEPDPTLRSVVTAGAVGTGVGMTLGGGFGLLGNALSKRAATKAAELERARTVQVPVNGSRNATQIPVNAIDNSWREGAPNVPGPVMKGQHVSGPVAKQEPDIQFGKGVAPETRGIKYTPDNELPTISFDGKRVPKAKPVEVAKPVVKPVEVAKPQTKIQQDMAALEKRMDTPKPIRVEEKTKTPVLEKPSAARRGVSDIKVRQSAPEIKQQVQKGIATAEKEAFKSNSKKITWLDKYRTPDRIFKKMGLEKEHKKYRVQKDIYEKELPKYKARVDTWYSELKGNKESQKKIFHALDGEAVVLNKQEKRIAEEIRSYFKEWADELGLPPDKRVTSYITHLFDDQIVKNSPDADLSSIIANEIPNSIYNPYLKQRMGAQGYKDDLFAALDAYTNRALRKKHLDPALKAIAGKIERRGTEFDDIFEMPPPKKNPGHSDEHLITDESQYDYLRTYLRQVTLKPHLTDIALDNTANLILREKFGKRPITKVLQALRRWSFRGTIGGNLSPVLRNLSQGVNTYATLGEKYTTIGYYRVMKPGARAELEREGVLLNNFITDRAHHRGMEMMAKFDKGLYYFFDKVEKTNRGAAYFGAKAKYLSKNPGKETEAILYAKSIVRKTQFLYDEVDTPIGMSSEVKKTLLQLQTFTTKQIEFLAGMLKDKDAAGLIRYGMAGYVFVNTLGRAFGMEEKELLPMFRFGSPAATKAIWEGVKAGVNAPNKKGEERTLEEKATDVGKAALLLFPGGSQIKKTYEGSKAVEEGGVYGPSGRLMYLQGMTFAEKMQAYAFGKYASNEAGAFFDALDEKKKREKNIKPTYEKAYKLVDEGKIDEANALMETLDGQQMKDFKAYEAKVEEERNLVVKRKMLPLYLDAKALNDSGQTDKANEIFNNLSEDEQKQFEAVAKEAEGVIDTAEERNALKLVGAYMLAFKIDWRNASKALLTPEKLGRVKGNLVEMQRFYGKDYQAVGGSEDYIFKQLKLLGIPANERDNYRLEHIHPVKAGGDNNPENLRVVDINTHNYWTDFDVAIGYAVQDKKITMKEAGVIARDFKNGIITAEEFMAAIK